jgi:hypothetical protein
MVWKWWTWPSPRRFLNEGEQRTTQSLTRARAGGPELQFCNEPAILAVESRQTISDREQRMSTSIKVRTTPLLLLLVALVIACERVARADVLELVNGDKYSGTISGVTQTNVQFRSDVQGVINIPRSKVARITMGSATAPRTAVAGGAAAATAPAGAPATTPNLSGDTALVQQLRQQGVDTNLMNNLQQQVFGESSPEATQMFNDMVNGLKSGSLNVNDIRAEARKSIQQIEAAKKDLGGDAETSELLDGYAAILQKFLDEGGSAPSTVTPPAASSGRPGGPVAQPTR